MERDIERGREGGCVCVCERERGAGAERDIERVRDEG